MAKVDFSLDKYHLLNDEELIAHIHERLHQVHPHAGKVTISTGDRSYTLDKKEVYLCLRDENGKFYDFNMLMYVALHELAHCVCNEIGHTPKFHAIFEELQEIAHRRGLFDASAEPIHPYCEY